jgi:hypothetical protein
MAVPLNNHWSGSGRCARVLHINRLRFSALQIAAAKFSGSCQRGTLSRALFAKLAQAEQPSVWFEQSKTRAAVAEAIVA